MNTALGIVNLLAKLDGEKPAGTLYYGSIVQLDSNGISTDTFGGLGGYGRGVGGVGFGGVMWHELGHAYGLGHAGGEYENGNYPYPNGGHAGSAWAYNLHKNMMMDVFAQGTMNLTTGCKSNESTIPQDDYGRCYMQVKRCVYDRKS